MTDQIQSFDFSVRLMRALLWQYDKAENLQAILQSNQDWYDANQETFWKDWIKNVYDLQTANEFGLSVWAIILQIPIVVSLAPAPVGQLAWGFGQYNKNFENGNFKLSAGGAQVLSPEQARLVLQLRYFQLQSSGTIPETNRFLRYIFGEFPITHQSRAWLEEGPDPMTLVYVFAFLPSSQLQFVLENYDILPRPAGVGASYEIRVPASWGFDEFHQNFDNGNFAQ